jgi:hypothetical protein
MKLSPLLTLLTALLVMIILGGAAAFALQPPRPLLDAVSFTPSTISPNADGRDDATRITYTLNRNAELTIRLKNEAGEEYFFRKQEIRSAQTYQMLFSGIVIGYTRPGESFDPDTQLITRLIPNGKYTVTVSARTATGESEQVTTLLTVQESDSALPLIQGFSVSPTIFTPNQDGIADRVAVNAYLPKKADLAVYLTDSAGIRYDLPERIELRDPGDPGAHFFDYDGGVDNKVKPPPNGDYTLIAETQDDVGQRLRRRTQLTVRDGGLPQVEIQPQVTGAQVFYEPRPYATTLIPEPKVDTVMSTQARITVKQGDLLTFRLIVHNYGNTPVRTLAPWPGTPYQWTDLYTGKLDPQVSRSGVWFVGLQCETSETSFPYRWAVGSPETLTKVTDSDGQTFYYLMPGQRAVVWGAVQMSKLVKSRNPQECYAALIHEDKEIPPMQSRVGPIKVELIPVP